MSNADDSAWQELIKDVQPLPKPKTTEKNTRITLRVTPKISPDRVYGENASQI